MLYCHDDSCRSAPMPAIFALPMLASLITYLVQGVDLGNVLGPVKVRNEGHHPQRWQKRAIQPFQKLFLLLVSPGLAIRIVFITGRRRVDGDEFDFFSFLVLGDGIHGVCIGISLTRKICVKNRYYQPIPIFHSRLRRRMYLRREWAVYLVHPAKSYPVLVLTTQKHQQEKNTADDKSARTGGRQTIKRKTFPV